MIKSMTGYGRSERVTAEYKLIVEIKSVNHRYLDLSIKLPRIFNSIENTLRNNIKKYLSRGKTDVYITFEDYSDNNVNVRYNAGIAKGYAEAFGQAKEELSLSGDLLAGVLIRCPEVITLEDVSKDMSDVKEVLLEVFDEAGKAFRETRETEGRTLYEDITAKLDFIEKKVSEVESISPTITDTYRDKIMEKVSELLGDRKVDDAVLATELVVFSDKICVDEETVRLRAHIDNMRKTLQLDESIGRKLDFVAQEMNREANTILSKAGSRDISAVAIDLKTEIEKIREQIQNIE